MDPELAWEDLTAAALLGTERRAFAPPSAGGALGSLLGGLAGREPERALLGTAAALATYRRAGRLPTADPGPPVEPAAVDGRPRCSVASDGHLGLILSGTHAEVLGEWLTALASAGRRPAEEAIPGLLDAGRARVELRPGVAAAVGPLGAWLARQNPDWAYAAGLGGAGPEDDATVEARWQTGTLLERTELLRRARRADPARGRALVASTWEADGFEARAAFVGAFEVGLGGDDRDFLEARLDDRRKEVRSAAAGLLARLPGSALVARMAARVAPLLGFAEPAARAILGALRGEPGLDAPPPAAPAKPFKEVALPESCDKAMIRDGIEPKPGRAGVGERAWWLSEMLARVPPSAWSRAWGLPPAELAAAAVKSKWNDALFPGLFEAAIVHGDFEWLDALLPHRRLAGRAFEAQALLGSLPADRREAATLALVRADDGKRRAEEGPEPLTEEQCSLIASLPGPWGEGLSGEVLGRLAVNLAGKGQIHYALANLIRVAARSLPTAAALAVPPRRTAEDVKSQSWLFHEVDRALEAFHAAIQFRHEMTRELRA